MRRFEWPNGLRAGLNRVPRRRRKRNKRRALDRRLGAFELLEDRCLLAVDFGDAPDTGLGIGPGNYNTLSTDNGPQHTIVVGLQMGTNVDGDGGVLQNAVANADDVNGALPDDEDGLANPAADLTLTIGAEPTVNVWVTNTTGLNATLYGWIDYNADGVFDNATERASVAVPAGTNSETVTLTFPTVPSGFTGTTYARFRLSTDAAAANPTGAAADGEVEDYLTTIMEQSGGTVENSKTETIGNSVGGGPPLVEGDDFARAIASIGDLDGDGVTDMAVGAREDDTGGSSRGAVYILFMNSNGSVRSHQKIAHDTAGGPTLANGDAFGVSVAALGDLDGDGVTDIAVGASYDDTGENGSGAVYVLFMNADGTVKSNQKIASGVGGGPILAIGDFFGRAVASLGDFDGNGVGDMVVGATGDFSGGSDRGAVYVLLMNADGTVQNSHRIASDVGGGPSLLNGTRFGSSIASLGDLDSDQVGDIVVGIHGDGGNLGGYRGAVYVLFMNADGTVKSSERIADDIGGGPILSNGDFFGRSVTALGDLDADGVGDMAVGAYGDNSGGAVYVLYMNANGTVKESGKIAGTGITNLTWHFGISLTMLGDLDGDGLTELAVASRHGFMKDVNQDAVNILYLQRPNHFTPEFTLPTTILVPENSTAVTTVTATDADVPAQPLTFSIVGGTDEDWFEITSDGELSFTRPQDFAVPIDADRDNVYIVTVEVSDGHGGIATQTIDVVVTDVDDPPSVDFGDAPDLAAGTGPGNYNTLSTDDGPQHTIVAGLRLGTYVDGDGGILENGAANADDANGALPIDEDGLTNPAAYLTLTVGTQPTVNARVTNSTGAEATLYGWIDYDADGVFDNATERASVAVPDGTDNEVVTLQFPAVPSSFTGATYARFRLSTDPEAANPTGAATDGEVEDYRATIVDRGIGQVDSAKSVRITSDANGGPTLINGDRFGRSVTTIGDLDGDGVIDLAVGADQYRNSGAGTVYVLFMNNDGTVKGSQKIVGGIGGGGLGDGNGTFGTAVTSLGDLDGDGLTDIAVGDSAYGSLQGAVHVLFLNADGTAKRSLTLASEVGGIPYLEGEDQFGHSVSAIGDLDGDGVTELAVGTPGNDIDIGPQGVIDETGAVYVLFMNTDGTAKSVQKISHEIGGGPTLSDDSYFGMSVTSLGDFDGDGVNDLAVGAGEDDENDRPLGMAFVLLLNEDGTVKSSLRIGRPPVAEYDQFGSAIASLGDIDGDGVTDIAVGASKDDTGGWNRGAIYVLLLNADGTTKSSWKIADNTNGGPSLADYSRFGRGVTPLGDLDGDGITDLAVGATGGYSGDPYGSVHILFLKPVTPDYGDAPDTGPGTGSGNYQTLASDNGPSHVIVNGLRLGGGGDSDSGTLENSAANADNANGPIPGDEDGLVNPVADLQWTVGTVPKVNLWATNTTGADAMLYGWIDYNADGVFDNATERASIAVPNGTSTQIVTLTFPTVPNAAVGTTYARFRLSTDAAAADPTGPAADGEVEDHRVQITAPSRGTVESTKTIKIGSGLNGGPTLDNHDDFADSVASLGDLDGDGIGDIVVGSTDASAVFVLFMNRDGTVKDSQEISYGIGGGPNAVRLGRGIAALGDLDGNGVTDIAVTSWDGIYVIHLKCRWHSEPDATCHH